MNFTKMNGAGNDFIIIEDLDEKLRDLESLARKLCDRHFGIGGDGILVLRKSDRADAEMILYNSDGSPAEMCGNGVRCFARYMYDNGYGSEDIINVGTGDGVKKVKILKEDGRITGAEVNMGKPQLSSGAIPSRLGGESVINRAVQIGGVQYSITSMNMGVPHTIIFVEKVDDGEIMNIGPKIEKCELFPNGTNVNFVKVQGKDEFALRTWERGAGLTMACGTGACASLAACYLNNKTGKKALAHLLGGDLSIQWDEDGSIYMTGPCETVFKGEI